MTRREALGALALLAAGLTCAKAAHRQAGGSMPRPPIEDVLRARTEEWLQIPGVVGTALGERAGEPCILVLVERRTEEVARRIPAAAGGYPVVVKVTGELRPVEADRR